MPPKAKLPAPIDRPLSRAYLREFGGWSTAYPPGLSDPTTLKVMENTQINRDGSIRVRPGLRYLSFAGAAESLHVEPVGTHEVFFLNDGSKAYLFAVREEDGRVGFRVLATIAGVQRVKNLTDPEIGFDIPQGESVISFNAGTTYVKYLQIDNKIFALSNAGESMRRFQVGVEKKAQTIVSITRPEWLPADKLTVVHPEAAWYQVGTPLWTRTNLVLGGNFEYPRPNSSGYIDPTKWVGFNPETEPTNSWYLITSLAGGKVTSGSQCLKITQAYSYDYVFQAYSPVTAGKRYRASAQHRTDMPAVEYQSCVGKISFYDASNSQLGSPITKTFLGEESNRPQFENILAPTGAVKMVFEIRHGWFYSAMYIDEVIIEEYVAGLPTDHFDGDTLDSAELYHDWTGTPGFSTSTQTKGTRGLTIPTAETPTTNTLISSDASKNVYNFGFFYTFSNEIGESAASQVTVVSTQRPWSNWLWNMADATGEPTGAETNEPSLTADQLATVIPQSAYNMAKAQGATHWNLYMFTWSDQSPVPNTAVRVGTKKITATGNYGSEGWQSILPGMQMLASDFAVTPTLNNRYNYSDPSCAGQGLVAADRMIMVYDPLSAGVIRWSANQQGDYSNFTAAKGGGYKTLTSGNLYIPACVKLWQNPQSVDTLTVLCMGIDGMSTAYYMMPAEVSAQSETTQIMGFEETTATPGTTSPFGVEIFNNAMYHPLDDQLMKSTANNYNISHKTQTEIIRNKWEALVDKHHIVSSQYDGRLYFIVHNPDGAGLEEGCWGNEIWVLDAQAETGTWSRWTIQAQSLRRIEQGGKVYMSVIRPDGIYYLDPEYDLDDCVPGFASNNWTVTQRTIPWKLETNTQGANRAHDAWCHLQQANIIVGNFTGEMRYGIRGYDQHGKVIEVEKIYRSPQGDVAITDELFDHEDMLMIKRDLKEWFFFAESNVVSGVHQRSFGQINLVQYRYAPVSVNVGYEYGSVETFEYGHAGASLAERTSINGVPIPMLDARRP